MRPIFPRMSRYQRKSFHPSTDDESIYRKAYAEINCFLITCVIMNFFKYQRVSTLHFLYYFYQI